MNQLVSKKIIDIILDHKKNANVLSEVEFLKCQLGVEIFLINLSKMIII
jgi:accessory gene regulator protein AgrB